MDKERVKEQTKIYFDICKRKFINEKRWFSLIGTIVIISLVTCVVGKELYKTDTMGAFTVVCACIWIGLFNSIQIVCRDRKVIKNEYHEGICIEAYIFACAWFEIFVCTMEAFIIAMITFIRFHGNIKNIMIAIALLLSFILILYCADMLGLLISTIAKKSEQAMTIMPFILIFQLVFAGVIFENLKGIFNLFSKVTISKWGYEAIINLCDRGKDLAGFFSYKYDGSTNFFLCWLLLILFAAIFIAVSSQLIKLVKFDKRDD